MEELEKNKYIPPIIEVNPVIMDTNIALQSPVNSVDLDDWAQEEEFFPDPGDIFIAI